MPKVSIIIPIYNVEKYLVDCLVSVTNQTLQNIEIIYVDDGSTDNSINILNEFAKKDSRITVLQQKNQYAGVARNNGLKIAKGEYVIFLDSDDFFDTTMLEKMLNRAVETDADITICKTQGLNELTHEIYPLFCSIKEYTPATEFKPEILKDKIFQFCVG